MVDKSNTTRVNVIHWFRKGLRLHDNPSLKYACDNAKKIYPLFIFDPQIKLYMNVGANRWRFLFESLKDLDKQLRSKYNLRLYVARGKPQDIFNKLINKWQIKLITYEYDIEPYALERDKLINNLCINKLNCKIYTSISHTLYDASKIKQLNSNKIPLTYQKFQTIIDKLGLPSKPCDVPDFNQIKERDDEVKEDDDDEFKLPTLEEIDINEEKECDPLNKYPGGELEALKRLELKLSNKQWICKFEKPETSPNSLEASTTVLSPYLKFGCLSSRLFYYKLLDIYNEMNGKHTRPPVSLHGQLLWREFFYSVAQYTPNFDKIDNNPICKQIKWIKNDEYLDAWRNAKTGYPFIDAIMIQLKKEGWIHHLARHAVACFLTRGDLYQSWLDGVKIFEEYLLDADWALNNANWMWLSASAFFNQYYRVYSPIAFGKKTDPLGLYIKHYIPILDKYPSKYIYEPWLAPLDVQKKANCIIGKDYPFPIVDHLKVSKENIKRMKESYQESKK